ncbi:MAG TPA: P1 family peptidase [Dehalococcoidia bacterium]|nr:P1 family peptidase [Dehalococcoidia bacterium]
MADNKLLDAITDVAGIKVGHWTDADAATGCTVVICERGAVGGVDVRGAAPGTYETDALRPGNAVPSVHAVLLTGGSAFGLDAASGVMRWCEEHAIGFPFGGAIIPIVAGAVIFDLGIGRGDVRPDAKGGYDAASSARPGPVAEGSVGVGTGATVAKLLGRESWLKGGVGTASEALAEGVVVGALVAVNAVGDVIDPSTGSVLAGPRGDAGAFADTMSFLRSGRRRPVEGNTTIGVVATNAKLTKEQANRLAVVAHDGLARAIRPAHTQGDGDTMFAMATGEVELHAMRIIALEAMASLAVERAIVKAVLAATSLAGVPSRAEWRGLRQQDQARPRT